jgi:hypothetical protein
MKRLSLLFVLLTAIALVLVTAASCEDYEPPPRPTIVGLQSGTLDDPRAPVVIDFGMPIDPDTLFVKIVLANTDAEGNLPDEDADPDTTLRPLVRRDPLEGDVGAKAEVDAEAGRLVFVLDAALPVGPKLMLLVEGGLESKSGRVLKNRTRIPFSYVVKCAARPSKFASGAYFVLLDVEQPIGVQLQLLAYLEVDPDTGALTSQFTNADRNPEQKCPMACPSTDVCRLLPAPECVLPATRAGTADEYPDWIPNSTPPVGYSFLVEGCAVDDGTASGVLTAPTTMVVESPNVTVEGLTMTSSFGPGPDGQVRATGSLTADLVRLGVNPLGPGKGSMSAIRIPDDRIPANLPRPAPRSDAGATGSGGANAGR